MAIRCPMRLRRVLPIRIVLASLALGLLATAASVVIPAYRFARQPFAGGWPSDELAAIVVHEDRVQTLIAQRRAGLERWTSYMHNLPTGIDVFHVFPRAIEPHHDPRPTFARLAFSGPPGNARYARAGWPVFAAEGREVSSRPKGASNSNTSRSEWLATVPTSGLPAQIPMRPIPLGVLANTLFYAAPTLVLLATLRLALLAWRTRRRAKRGRCPACGYELGEGVAVCPECGPTVAGHTMVDLA